MSSKDDSSPRWTDAETDQKKCEESDTAKRKSNGFEDDEKIKRQKIEATSEATDDEESPNAVTTQTENNDQSDIENPQQAVENLNIEEPKVLHSPSNFDEKESDDEDASISTDKESNLIKKGKAESNDRKVQNLRKNIKDVIDESQLDETTLVAQRQESERLARLQEHQKLIRENQRQIAADKQACKTQQKVLSLLQGESPASSAIDFNDPIFEKLNFNSSISITPAAKEALNTIQSLISTEDHIPESGSDSDDDVVIQPVQVSKPVVIDSSSDSDDCVILSSDEDEEEIPEEDEDNSGEHTNDLYNQKDSEGRVVVNIGHSESNPIYIAPQIARIIKPHQIGGIRFLFDNIIENVELFEKSSGFGCLLAHSMGLGKTLQLVCFCDIFLRHTSAKKIIIIMPINTLQNWLNEFNMWLPLPEKAEKSPLKDEGEVRPRHFNIFVLNDSQKTLAARAKTVIEWSSQGGVLLLGYEMYRLLSLRKTKKKKGKSLLISDEKETLSIDDQDMFDKISQALVNPGPDLVVCDEGHRIKNAHATTSMALKQIKTKRRVVLTGYPLQNNLLEYWCMVDFTRPSYLGTKTEFCNMFERPIQNGQCIDSTPQDCKLMRYRAHVLHSLLKGFVQRRSHTVLQKSLPEKTEFVLMFRMTEFQRKLYTVFMNEVVRSKKVPNPLKAFAVCCKIWNHPDVLYNFLKKRELDLDIEPEETELVGKGNSASVKKKGRKAKDPKQHEPKSNVKEKNESQNATNIPADILNTVATTSSEKHKSSNALSNDSSYSTNCNSYDSSSGSLNSYAGFHNYETGSTQNYGYSRNGYQNWNDGGYWQSNYYHSEYTQSYNQTQPYQPYCPNSKHQESAIDPASTIGSTKYDAGLLADVIKEETMSKNPKNHPLDEIDKKEMTMVKNSRDDGIPYDWAIELMKNYVPDLLENSPKLEIFFTILNESVRMNDRLLVFSQSLLTLNLIEKFLQRNKIPNTDNLWVKNTYYFRLDGTTAALEREKLINEFNANDTVKLFLVSTRAGSLGINLVGANRVIVFDASWNPCHDTQAVCRVYRYGQTKPCYVYRFVMDNCLEKKIYDRQINKQGMSDRIVDECNPDAHLSLKEVTSLCYDDGIDPEVKDFSVESHKYEDMVSKKVLELHSKSLTKEPFKQESLLVDRKEKKLSQAEKRLAQKGYELEKQAATKPLGYNTVGTNYRPFRSDGSTIHRSFTAPRSEHNELSEESNFERPSNPRPNRWVPVEVWQSKGLTAQEMTLPQDVSIQTNSADKSKIYLKAGQKVIVLKSPKGICLQLESGKVIAIRASSKSLQPNADKLENFSIIKPSPTNTNLHRPLSALQNSGDIIDISNDDDDDEAGGLTNNLVESTVKTDITGTNLIDTIHQPYKEKMVYKPNLVKRRSKTYPPASEPTQLGPFDMNFHNNKAHEWNTMNPYTIGSSHVASSRASDYLSSDKPEQSQSQHNIHYGQSSFQPSNNDHPSYAGVQYGQQSAYQPFQQNYSQPQEFSRYNSNSTHPYQTYPNNSSSYNYPVQENYDANMSNYHAGYNLNYNQTTPKHSFKLPDAPT